MDTEQFFPERGMTRGAPSIQKTLAICAGCTVRQECLDEAMRVEPAGGRVGIRGGLLGRERDRLAAHLEITPGRLQGHRPRLSDAEWRERKNASQRKWWANRESRRSSA